MSNPPSPHLNLEKTIVTDLMNPEDFLFSVRVSPIDKALVACSTSKNVINFYNIETNNLISRLNGHTNTISDIIWTQYQPDLLFSCSLDNTVRGWDLRTNTCPFVYNGDEKSEAFYSVDFNGSILVGGSLKKIFFLGYNEK